MIKSDLTFREWTNKIKKEINNKSGIYSVYLGHKRQKTCIYVGATINLKSRVNLIFNPRSIKKKLLNLILTHYKEKYSYLEVNINYCKTKELV